MHLYRVGVCGTWTCLSTFLPLPFRFVPSPLKASSEGKAVPLPRREAVILGLEGFLEEVVESRAAVFSDEIDHGGRRQTTPTSARAA